MDEDFFVGILAGIFLGVLGGATLSEHFNDRKWQNEALKNGVGEYDKETGKFKLLNLK